MANTQRERLTKQEREALANLRTRGYAVIVWTPKELRTASPTRVEDRSIELGWEVIEDLQGVDGDA